MCKIQDVIVVVDPYSSGKFLVEEFQLKRIPVVAVRSTLNLTEYLISSVDWSVFTAVIDFTTVEKCVSELDRFSVRHVVAGSEPGVNLAEILADKMGFPNNGPCTGLWRRNKYAQQERLREVGLRAIKQFYSNDVQEILEWVRQEISFPLIVKPATSAGTEGVYWCHDENDIINACEKNLGETNLLGIENDKVLVQEFLDGLEYVVDSVSHEGRHVLSGVWVYSKKKNPETKSIVYERTELLPSTGVVQDQIVTYVHQCLDALNIKFGPSHAEVFMTSRGPCLVEVGNRLHGAYGPKMIEWATGLGTHELAADVFLDQKIFQTLWESQHKYQLKNYTIATALINQNEAGILQEDFSEPIEALASVKFCKASYQVGEFVPITRDMTTSPAEIVHVHSSMEQIMRDYHEIRELESSGLYKLSPM